MMKRPFLHFLIYMLCCTAVKASDANTLFLRSAAALTSVQAEDAVEGISDFKAKALSPSSIELTWRRTPFLDPIDYQIERAATKTNETVLIEVKASFLSTTVSYTDNGLEANNTYSYRVKEAGAADFSPELLATTEDVAPTAPTGLTAGVTSSSVTLTWEDNADNETKYIVERAIVSTGPFTVVAQLGEDVTNYEDTGLAYNTTYYYRVKAQNDTGDSDYTATAMFTTLNVVPIAPSSLTATASSSSAITLHWEDNADNETGYVVEWSTTGTTFTAISPALPANTVTYTHSSLTHNTQYFYRISAQNEIGSSDYVTASATTLNVAPAKPSSLIATPTSSSSITLTWTDNADNEASYVVEWSTEADGGFEEITPVLAANTTEYIHTALKYNTRYYYRVKARNTIGDSEYATASATTLNVAPAKPTSLIAAPTSSSSITLTWTDNADNETSYVVEWSTEADGGFEEIAPVLAANTTEYIHTALKYNTRYYYRVKARNGTGDSEHATASATTLNVVPAKPTALVGTAISISSIQLDWVDNADNEKSYVVEISSSGEAGPFTAITSTLGPNTTTYTHNGLISNTVYHYRVRAINEIGNSDYSNIRSVRTKEDLPILLPTSLNVTVSTTNALTLSWTNNAANATGFILERTLTPNDDPSFKVIATLGIGQLTYIDEGLKPNTTYFYRVKAINKDGESSYSNIAGGTTKLEVGVPAAPTQLKATAVSTFQINLSWKDNADNETSYIVVRANQSDGPFTSIATLPANTVTYENIGLKANTTYYYKVIASNIHGNTESDIVQANTFEEPQPPAAPTGLSAVAVSTVQINLSWKDNSNSETNFKIERSTSQAGPFEFVAAVGANVTTYPNFSLSPNTRYYYRVQAISGDGASAYTNVANATTFLAPQPPIAPSLLTATGVSTTQINLSWRDNANNETGYVIERASTSEGTYSFIGSVGANVTHFESTGLNANTQYYYKVRAINNDGTSGYSNTASGSTLHTPQPPTPPTHLVAQGVSTTQINLSWQDNSSSETNFEVHRANSENGSYVFLANVPANQTTYESTGLAANTTYYYKVRASNGDGKSSFSNDASAKTSQTPLPPAAPDGLTAIAVSTTQINLKWNDRSDNETNFVIERSINNNTNFGNPVDVNANDTTFESTGLVAGTTYYYRIRAANEDGNSNYSNEVSATTPASGTPPNAPSDLYGKALSQTSIELFWMDNANNEDSFVLERAEEKEGQKGAFAFLENLNSNTTSYINSGLSPNTKYWYRIKAKNQDGESSYTESIAIITSVEGKPVLVLLNSDFPNFYVHGTEQMNVSIKVAEPTDIKAMKFMYKPLTATTWKEKVVSSDNDEYQVPIKQTEDFDKMGIEYYFLAEDAAGNQYVSPTGQTYLTFKDKGIELANLKFGADINAYQMISIPLVLTQPTVSNVFEDNLGTYDPSQWRLFQLENNQPVEVKPTDHIAPGKGYWLIVKEPSIIDTGEGHVVEKTQNEPFLLKLKQGWNLIGNPYNFDISWEDVLAHNGYPEGLESAIYIYKGATYELSNSLKTFEGAYVYADQDVDIEIPLSKNATSSNGRINSTSTRSQLAIEEESKKKGWEVGFTLKSDKLIYKLGGLGMHPEADLSKDKYDRIALPRLSEFIDLNFEHPEYFSPSFTKDIVPLQESFIWDMKVVSSTTSATTTVTWPNLSGIPADKELILYDPIQQEYLDMKKLNQYRISNGNATLQVYYGSPEFIAEHLQPSIAQIGKVYPNPFIEAFYFPVTLPKADSPYDIKLQLYNSQGSKIRQPMTWVLDAGFHDIQIDEVLVSQLNSGLYFYKIWIEQDDKVIEKSGRILKE